MKYRVPDIKTADAFFEVFSDPKKVIKQLAEMRQIRDDILEGQNLKDMKSNAEMATTKAKSDMAEASEKKRATEEWCLDAESDLRGRIDAHLLVVEKGNAEIAETKERLAAANSSFMKKSTALKDDLENRLGKVAEREEALTLGESLLGGRETAVEAWAGRLKAASQGA